MSSNEHLEQPLWELIYGLLSPEEEAALHQRITSDPKLARAYSKVKLQSELVAMAAKCDDTQGRLVPPGEEVAVTYNAWETDIVGGDTSNLAASKSRSNTQRAANWIVAAAAIGLVVMSAISFRQIRPDASGEIVLADAVSPAKVALNSVRIELAAPSAWNKETSNFLSVRTSLDGIPQGAPLELTLFDADQDELYQVSIENESGTVHVELPRRGLPYPTRLEVRTRDYFSPPVSTSLTWAPSEQFTHLTTDRDTYLPGETIKFRTLSGLRFDQRLDDEITVEFEVFDDRGALIVDANHTITTEHGIGDGEFTIPTDATNGKLTIQASSPNGTFLTQRRNVLVRRNSKVADVSKIADLSNVADSLEIAADASPDLFSTPSPQSGRLIVEFFPEGGELVAGLRNNVYFWARDVNGQSFDLNGRIVDEEGNQVAQATTVHDGRGKFALPTQEGATYRLIPQESVEAPEKVEEFSLPPISSAATLVLNTSGQVLDADDQLEVTLLTRSPNRSLVLAATCRGRLVGWKTIEPSDFSKAEDGTSEYQKELTLAPEASGIIRITVHDSSDSPPTPMVKKLVYRRPAKQLYVLFHVVDSQQPGDLITLELQTTDEKGQPVETAMSLSVVDQARSTVAIDRISTLETLSYVTSEIRTLSERGFANFTLGVREEIGEESDESAEAMDMLLATQESFQLTDVVESEQIDVEQANLEYDYLVRDVRDFDVSDAEYRFDQFAPIMLDNQAAIENQRVALARASIATTSVQPIVPRQLTRRRWGTVLMAGSLLVLLAVLVLAFTRSLGRPRVWVPSVVTAGMVAVLGVFWMGSQVNPLGEVAHLPGDSIAKQPATNNRFTIDAVSDITTDEDADAGLYEIPGAGYQESYLEAAQSGSAKQNRQAAEKKSLDAITPAEQRYAGIPSAETSGGFDRGSSGRSISPGGDISGGSGDRLGGGGLGGGGGFGGGGTGATPKREIAKSKLQSKDAGAKERMEAQLRMLDAPRDAISKDGDDKAEAPALAQTPTRPSAIAADEPLADTASRLSNALVPEDATPRTMSRDRTPETENELLNWPDRRLKRRRGTVDFVRKLLVSNAPSSSTVLWQPLVVTDADGRVTVSFQLPPANATYVLRVDAHGDGRIGSAQAIIKARQP